MIGYLDTSAAMKLLVEEAESDALLTFVQSGDVDDLVASWLLHTELHCASHRHPADIDPAAVRILLDTVTLVDVARGDLLTAGSVVGRLRSNDAIHLAVALRLSVDTMITYDDELMAASEEAGLSVLSPA